MTMSMCGAMGRLRLLCYVRTPTINENTTKKLEKEVYSWADEM